MFANIAPLLKSIKVSVSLSQRDNGEYVAIIVPRPRFQTGDKTLNNMVPLIRVHNTIEGMELALASEDVASNIRSYHHAVVNDEAFKKALAKKASHEDDGEGAEADTTKTAPAKRGGRKPAAAKEEPAQKAEEPKVSKEEKLILLGLKNLETLINAANKDGAKSKFKEIVGLYNHAISEEGGSVEISESVLTQLQLLKEKIKIMPEQVKMNLDMDLD